MTEISPLMRLSCKKSIKLAEAINSPLIVIPIYEFICDIAAKPNKLFKKIKKRGGIHKYLNYTGIIILSSIMKDELIKKFDSSEKYSEIINGLLPNYYFTPDGLTYEKRENESLLEIIRLSSLTPKIIDLCPNSRPIGLVKGCNRLQILAHRNFLQTLGIVTFAFHTGDFFREGDNNMIKRAKYYCSLIKEKDNFLMLYGFGSPNRMLEFSFSDMFITYTHFVNAKHKKIFVEKKKRKFAKGPVYRAALYNFKELQRYLRDSQCQTKLIGGKYKWGEETQEEETLLAIKNQELQD